jgi:SnoaL-like domain
VAVATVLPSNGDVRTFVAEYFEAWSEINEDLILSYYSETISLEIPGTIIKGKAALRDQFVWPFVGGFPGNRHVVKNMIFGKRGRQSYGRTYARLHPFQTKAVPKSN